MYADDLKFYCSVTDSSNALQSDLDRLVSWCEKNYLKLNVNKCKKMVFYKRQVPFHTEYKISGATLESVLKFNDLGVVFDKDLSFNSHVDQIVAKSLRLLGFIKRNTRHMTDTRAISLLYNSLIRSILEYCSIIWSPIYQCHINRLERVQNKFAKYLLYKHRFPYYDLSYETRILMCGLKSLEARQPSSNLFV